MPLESEVFPNMATESRGRSFHRARWVMSRTRADERPAAWGKGWGKPVGSPWGCVLHPSAAQSLDSASASWLLPGPQFPHLYSKGLPLRCRKLCQNQTRWLKPGSPSPRQTPASPTLPECLLTPGEGPKPQVTFASCVRSTGALKMCPKAELTRERCQEYCQNSDHPGAHTPHSEAVSESLTP